MSINSLRIAIVSLPPITCGRLSLAFLKDGLRRPLPVPSPFYTWPYGRQPMLIRNIDVPLVNAWWVSHSPLQAGLRFPAESRNACPEFGGR